MKVLLIDDSEDNLSQDFLERWTASVEKELLARRILSAEDAAKELSLVFLKELDAKQLNWTYRQKDYATDVLSFETEDPESFGELVLCPAVLKKQAKEHRLSFELEVGYMILHGILHLLGYDHENAPEERAREMLALQDEIFELLTKPKVAKKKAKPKAAAKKAKKTTKKNAASSAKRKKSRH